MPAHSRIALLVCSLTLVVGYLLPMPRPTRSPASSLLRVQGQRENLPHPKSRLAAGIGIMGIGIFSLMRAVSASPSLSPDPVHVADKIPALYNSYATTYNILDGGQPAEVLGINKMRAKAGEVARGDVLEVAVGTGLELDYLNLETSSGSSKIKSLVGIDISTGMLSEAEKRLRAVSDASLMKVVPTRLLPMDASAMEFPDNSFDTVQSTFSFCVFEEPEKVLREMMRVVKPGGQVLLLENSVSTFKPLAVLQDLTEPIITPLSKNCRWNVDVPKMAEKVGLELQSGEAIQAGTVYYGVYSK
jgi:ubiquinone/menaquinone biosynthesis C-methylase UbiE